MIELPYILNLNDGGYEFSYSNKMIGVYVNNDYYALTYIANSFQLSAAIGKKEALLPHLNESYSLVKARTIISFTARAEVEELENLTGDELIDALRREMPKKENHPTKEEAQEKYSLMSEEQKLSFENKERVLKTARILFPPSGAYECIAMANHFIRHYSVFFNDHFSEEISLYQAASGLTNGVMIEHFFGGSRIDAAPVVGLFPPLLRGPLYTHTEEQTNAFRSILKRNSPSNESSLLLIRAKNLNTKGAYRSAALEASAAIENYIRLNLIKKMRENGLNDELIEETLSKNHFFEDRCKKIFRQYFNHSVPEIAPLEWQNVKHDRDIIRHKTTHTSHEPTEREVSQMTANIEFLIEKLNAYMTGLNTK
ncbi:MAG: hypothetical protein E7J63_09855 [Pantoea sp.]|uniref:hypothetical protein n=1 Tax=Pantoea sp. TaxID=69393 RepID=UPI00290E4F3B|nr:hypothetical protein [Pantoea sp.]MDU7838601.1 hypothetical protein [Pantoea sp.]